ncbi:elongation factor G-like protein EF-G2 [Streptomyces tsukubensis]|uniref:Elongation factor G n=1 Tax=Streptomyces tsukubensis TaxID=83656 RepID=A0A1V4AF21_9ACTN|nr:elongation factor G-like protein EF-G2 [Streptomyces tsukubensis]OON82141.1 elongation factor G [Streptomyces tsukubensis]QFR92625.1 elongation factor G-like protein EF-G2 [Streptomyces tsukubensis]
MGDKTNGHSGAAGRATGAPAPSFLRNVVLVGNSGSGKTTLAEALAMASGAVQRAGRVEDGTTVSDYDSIEHRRQRSVQLSLLPLDWGGYKINLLDAPGYADFVGELRAGLRAADAALFVVSATAGVDGATRMVWDECAAVSMPRAIVITHLEAAGSSFEQTTEECAEAFGPAGADTVLPLYLPFRSDPAPGAPAAERDPRTTALAGLLSRQVHDYASGEHRQEEPAPERLLVIEAARARLIEGIIAGSEDESLMDRYLAGEDIDFKTLVTDLERAVARGNFHPVLAAAPAPEGSRQGLGTVQLLELITGAFPTPAQRPAPEVTTVRGAPVPAPLCDPQAPLVAEVVKTTSDLYVGRVSLVRVFSGTLRPEASVRVTGHGLLVGQAGGDSTAPGPDKGEGHVLDERVGALSTPFGKQQNPLTRCGAGDLACVAKLGGAETGDTLSARDHPVRITPWNLPEPLLPLAVEAHSKTDEDKLSGALARVVAEDPVLRLEQNQDTHQLVLWCLGEAHADVVLERLSTRFGVRVDVVEYRVPLRETFAARASGRGRHVKQSGGHGQYAICEIAVEPLPGGSGIEFVDKVVGGAVPRQFIPSVEKGVRTQAGRGLASGHPLTDIRVVLLDGRSHSVDSSDAAFQTAGALALREAAAGAAIHLLEPVCEIRVVVPDAYVGAVMTDLSARRGRVVGTEQAPGGRTLVRAEAPEIEIQRYAVDLRSLSHGTARFGRSYTRHAPVPAQVSNRLRAGHDSSQGP